MADLFTPYNLGDLNLSHRVVLAPMTRCRALRGVPQPCHVDYYFQRTTKGGLLITEATAVSDTAPGFPRVPGIHTEEQIGAWKEVVDAVHSKGGIVFCQLWHDGRASHQTYRPDHGSPISSSDIPISSKLRILLENGTLDEYTSPRALETFEVPRIVEEYRLAAINSVRAGFDGIEIHGGHGYLIDQFLKEIINNRTDEYGGSIENRCRFLMDIIDATTAVFGVDRVGVRISPVFHHNDASVSDPLGLGLGIIGRINEFQTRDERKLSYLHVTRPRFLGILWPDGENERKEARVTRAWRDAYEGTFMSSGGFTRDTRRKTLEGGDADLVAYGRLFISNPDLVHRFKKVGTTLTSYERTSFYTSDPVVGYTDYPFLCNKIDGSL